MTDKSKETKAQPAPAEDATDAQLEKVAGGRDRVRDERGAYREGEWGGHHYHEGYRGRWEGGIFIQL